MYEVIVVCILVTLFCYLTDVPNHKVWAYADDEKTMEHVKKWYPDSIVLTKKTYKGYVTIPEELLLHPAFHGDKERFVALIRIWVLAEHGGIWVDSEKREVFPWNKREVFPWDKRDVFPWDKREVFPWYIRNKEFSGWYKNGSIQGTMGCVKGSPFIRAWRDEISQIVRYPSVDVYVNSRVRMGLKKNDAIQIAAQKVLIEYSMDTLLLRDEPVML